MKLRLPRRRVWRAGIYLLSLLLVLLAIDLVLVEMGREITPAYDTTRIVAPALPDGSIDYLVALDDRDGRGVSPEDNAVPLLLKAFGRLALPSNQPDDGITDRLGMPHLPEQGNYFVRYEQFDKTPGASPQPDLFDPPAPLRWPRAPSEKTAKWVKANEGPLALVEQASRRTRFFVPFYGGYRPEALLEVLLPHLAPIKQSADALLLRAVMRLQEGDVDGCRQDLLTVHQLGRLVGQAPTLVERALASILEITACRLDRAVAASGKLSAQQAREFAAELAKLPDLAPPTDPLDGAERFSFLDAMQTGARLRPAQAGKFFNAVSGGGRVPPALFALLPISYERTMREANRWYDGAVAALRQPTYRDRRGALRLWGDALNNEVNVQGIRSLLNGRWMMALFIPALNRAHERHETAHMENRLSQVALALAAYKSDHHAFPAKLAELAPEYLPAIPLDSFVDKPLVYFTTPNGYTLYSVGPNMTDDGGPATSHGDDLVASQP